MFKLLKYLKPYKLELAALIALVFAVVASTLELPGYMAIIINEGIVKTNTALILHNGLIMLLIALIGVICTIAVGYLSSKIAAGFSRDIRNKVFSQVESFSLMEFNHFSTASLITRSTNDVVQIQTTMTMLLRMVMQAPIMGVWAIYKAYHLAPSLSWIIALGVVALIFIVVIIFGVALPKFKILQKLVDRLNLVARQNLTGLRVIRAFNNEKREEKKLDEANHDLTKINLFVNRLMITMQPAMMLILNLTSVLIVWFGARLISTGVLSIGNMIAFTQYALQVIGSFLMISIMFIMLPRASVSAGRVNEVLETELKIKDPQNPQLLSNSHGDKGLVEFKNVSFSYSQADSPVLKDISFIAKPGETTAFIGSTGSGKSTLINLIPRFYDVSSGSILIDGIDVRSYRLEDLYQKIGYVPQKGVLFSGTVESNVKYGAAQASSDDLKKYLDIAQASEFVKNLESNLQAPISQGGANLSGGQKQRLSIARALIKDPKILIFDDSFSALDFRTDANLRKALKNELKDKTLLIVAQRVSTILSAEKIIVLDNGEIVGVGSHQELFKSCEIYQEIVNSQLSVEDLKNLL